MCYESILQGNWEEHNAFDATHRISANMDLYNCSGMISDLKRVDPNFYQKIQI